MNLKNDFSKNVKTKVELFDEIGQLLKSCKV